jgi:hypothetical protein
MIGFIGTSLQLQSIITAHTLNSSLTTSIWRISDWSLTPRIHESTAFYNLHAVRIEITAYKGSISVLREHVISETMT